MYQHDLTELEFWKNSNIINNGVIQYLFTMRQHSGIKN